MSDYGAVPHVDDGVWIVTVSCGVCVCCELVCPGIARTDRTSNVLPVAASAAAQQQTALQLACPLVVAVVVSAATAIAVVSAAVVAAEAVPAAAAAAAKWP